MNIWDLPEPEDMPSDQINEYYINKYGKWMGGMDPEKGDKDNNVTSEELDAIDRFLKKLDEQNNPPNLDDDL